MYIETLMEEIQTAVLKGAEFEYHDEPYENPIFVIFGRSDFRRKERNAKFDNRVIDY